MVFNISPALMGSATKSPKRPFLNEIYTNNQRSRRSGYDLGSSLQKKQQLWRWFKSRPELNSPVSARVNDTIVDVDFFKPDGSPLGRNTRIEAEKFWEDNFMNERLKSIWFDSIVTGSGFGWKGKLKIDQVKEVCRVFGRMFAKKMGISIKEAEDRILLKAIDEDVRKTRVFDYIASSTMSIQHDETDVTGYAQNISARTVNFSPEEIIHFPFERVDGKVDGYTPVESLASELILIWFIKENMVSYMRNGGLPKKMFSLPEELANSDNHQFLVERLQEYGAVENRHGNLVFTGKVDVADLEDKLKDMEYATLAKYVTSNIAYALQVPNSRLPYSMDGSSTGDAGGLAESGYWSMIEADQKKIENNMNTQCLASLGFIMRFKKRHRQDSIREANALTMKADAIQKMQTIFRTYNQELTEKKIINLMDLNDEDVRKIPEERMMNELEKTGLMNQNLLNQRDVGSEPDKLKKNDTKRQAANNNPKAVVRDGV